MVGLAIARERGWTAPGRNRKAVTKGSSGRSSKSQDDAQDALFDTSAPKAAEHADTSRAESETKVDEEGDK
jgi:predicted kinase